MNLKPIINILKCFFPQIVPRILICPSIIVVKLVIFLAVIQRTILFLDDMNFNLKINST